MSEVRDEVLGGENVIWKSGENAMTIVQMQYFQAVCRYENFTKAAEELHISQPAMSAAMRIWRRSAGCRCSSGTRILCG